jgi:restriction system protein
MARRKQGAADDFLDLVAMLPWWAGVTLAFVSYFVLHRFAVVPTITPGQPGNIISNMMVAGLAYGGQILVPFLCVLGAITSFLRRRKREGLVANVQSRSADALNDMSSKEFELLVGEAFRLQGYSVTEQGGSQADGGVDLVLRKGNESFLVQCKQWKAFKVDVRVVRELYGVMAARGAAGGFVITSGSFTADAVSFAEGRNVRLVDGQKLMGLLQQAKAAARNRSPPAAFRMPDPQPRPAQTAEPLCPTCDSVMVRRTAKKGTNAGSQFWGCSRYPACRGTR